MIKITFADPKMKNTETYSSIADVFDVSFKRANSKVHVPKEAQKLFTEAPSSKSQKSGSKRKRVK